jgi:hypothetical protein
MELQVRLGDEQLLQFLVTTGRDAGERGQRQEDGCGKGAS